MKRKLPVGFDEWASGARTGTRLLSMLALGVSVLFLAGFGTWASMAPLAGAVVVPGTVIASGHDQQIQHLEGGIVRKIFVKEGDRVVKGEPLVAFDPTAAEAQRDGLRKRLIALRARAARLVAERDGSQELRFPADLQQAARNAEGAGILDEQRREFSARLKRHNQEQAIMDHRTVVLREQIDGTEVQRQALSRELKVVREEVERKKKLLDKGLAARDEYTRLLRSEAELVGQEGQVTSTLLATKTQISEVQEQSARLNTQRVETAASQLNDVRANISDATERLRSAEDVVSRLVVSAPDDGIIVKMNVNVAGSVVSPGGKLLDLLPTGRDMIVEAHVAPQDVDDVAVGQAARLRFSALNARSTPTVDAQVVYVSANRVVEQGRPYYTARLRIADSLPEGLDKDQIYPGMPVEVYVTTAARTFAEYLVKPITDSFTRAFRQD